ncbi:MAG TPA: 6-carboxytetrahydropterin synthase, partial [Gemmatimonadaceae bacterium]|nr:6-carboxytetrahydropterin synthase [Gemmatimonadaceae bacterium]
MSANVTVIRRLHFSAAHRVHNPAMSEEENRRTFGKCNNPNWHGHNYILDVAVTGAIDARTGYVIDLSRVKQIVEEQVIAKVD